VKAKTRRSFWLAIPLAMSMLFAACAPFQHRWIPATITDPHDNDVIPLGQQIAVRVDVLAAGESGWTNFEYTITDNGETIAHVGNESIAQRHLLVYENHAAPGVHDVQVTGRAWRLNSPGGQPYYTAPWTSNDVCFFVGPNPPPDFCATRTVPMPLVVAPTATHTPFPPTPIPVIDSADAYPSPIYYGDTCPGLSTVTFRAALTLPSGITADLVNAQAHVSVMIGSAQSNAGSLLVPLPATQTWDTTTHGQIFTGSLDLSHAYNDANNHFDPAALGGSSGALLWYVDASSHDPSFQNVISLGRTLNQVINLAPCPAAGENPPQHGNGNNPGSGSSGSSGGSPGGSGCAAYSNELSCDLAGCSWNPGGSSCTVSP
jgi:hypothetical protein